MSDGPATRLGCWIGADAESFAAALAASDRLEQAVGCRVESVGGERRIAAGAWSARFGADEVASLRELASREPDVALVLGSGWGLADLRQLLDRSQRVVVTAAPSLEDAIMLGESVERLAVAPVVTTTCGFDRAAAVLAELAGLPPGEGPEGDAREARGELGIRSVAIRFRAPPGPRGLDPTLIDACDLVSWSFGPAAPIESVMAMSRSQRGVSSRQSVGVLARDAFGRIATIDLAESAQIVRDIEWQLEDGRIALDDRGLRSWDSAGAPLDAGDSIPPLDFSDGIAGLVGAIRGDETARTGTRLLRTLALAEAAKLSLRTGNPESPGRLLDLAARP